MNPPPADPETTAPKTPPPPPKKALPLLGWGILLLAVVAVIATWVRAEKNPRSDLATVEASVIGIASRVGGPIRELLVEENQSVSAGDVLFVIDPEPFEIQAAIAAANLKALRGDLANAEREIGAQRLRVATSEALLEKARTLFAETTETYARLAPLLGPRYASPEQVDTARRAMESAAAGVRAAESEAAAALADVSDPAPIAARVAEAEATLAAAELAVRDCTVRAPFDGRIAGMNLARGAFVNPGLNVLMMLDTRDWHISADFPESVLARIREGQRATVQIMTAPGRTFQGRVVSIGWAVTSMPDLPIAQVPFIRRELDWVRLSQRFPVRIALTDPDLPADLLRSGVTASVTIETGKKP